jgi:hypothetical protein
VKVGNKLYEFLLCSFAILVQTRPHSEEKGRQNVTHTLVADVRSDLPFHAFLHISWPLLIDNS